VNPAAAAPATTDGSARASDPGRDDGWAEPRWLAEVRLRAARRVRWLRHLWSQPGYEGEHLLAISHSEVDRALLPPAEMADAEQAFYRSDERAAAISAQLSLSVGPPGGSRLGHLAATLGLTRADTALFVLAAAAAADPGLARVFGYLLDMAQPADPTPGLAAALFDLGGEPPPGPESAPGRGRRPTPAADGCDAFAGSVGWRADTTLLPALMRGAGGYGAAPGGPYAAADWPGGPSGRVVDPPPGPVLRPEALAEITGLARRLGDAGLPIEIELAGLPGSGRTALAAQAAARLGFRLVVVDATAIAARADAVDAATREIRRVRLEGTALAWEHADALPSGLWRALPPAPLTFLSVPVPAASPGSAGDYRSIRRSVRCEPIGRQDRLRLWSALAAGPAPGPVAEWALRPAEIRVAAQVAPAGDAEVGEVCRRLLMAGTPELLSPLPLAYTWDDLVLSPATAAHLRELDARARHHGHVLDDWGFSRLTPLGRGTTALFAGPSGTGKTMAAQVLARSLGLHLYRVDLAGVVSKYIGETEKRLREVFEACERAPVLLLFDEADALFGKRTQVSDAHDRYANIEIDYVLQQMEQFDGLAVLATNRKGDLDTAFVRRLRFIIGFAPPEPPERERLWRLALQDARDVEGRPLTGALDWARLARELDLTGAGIKSAAVAAAFLARDEGATISERHVLAAARRELEKQGVVVRPGQLEPR
jgi:AAA+ superfamily predicted ATPase